MCRIRLRQARRSTTSDSGRRVWHPGVVPERTLSTTPVPSGDDALGGAVAHCSLFGGIASRYRGVAGAWCGRSDRRGDCTRWRGGFFTQKVGRPATTRCSPPPADAARQRMDSEPQTWEQFCGTMLFVFRSAHRHDAAPVGRQVEAITGAAEQDPQTAESEAERPGNPGGCWAGRVVGSPATAGTMVVPARWAGSGEPVNHHRLFRAAASIGVAAGDLLGLQRHLRARRCTGRRRLRNHLVMFTEDWLWLYVSPVPQFHVVKVPGGALSS